MTTLVTAVVALAVAVAPFVNGQTFSACNPLQKSRCSVSIYHGLGKTNMKFSRVSRQSRSELCDLYSRLHRWSARRLEDNCRQCVERFKWSRF
jgi:hypothetical protein